MKPLGALKDDLLTDVLPKQRVLLASDYQGISRRLAGWIADSLNPEGVKLFGVKDRTSTAALSYLAKTSDNVDMSIMVSCIDVTNQVCAVKAFSKSGILLNNLSVDVSELKSESPTVKPLPSADLTNAMNTYRAHVTVQAPLDSSTPVNRQLPIIIAGMHGVAGSILPSVLRDLGYTEAMFVPEEAQPDGKFTLADPRDFEALADGMRYLRGRRAGMLLAIDPAGERMTVTVRLDSGEYRLLSSSEVAILMADYICFCRRENGILAKRSVLIDSADGLLAPVAKKYGIGHQVVAGDFKAISAQIEQNRHGWVKHPLVMATDGQDGYLMGQYANYRDALASAVVMCELYCYYESTPGVGMMDRLSELLYQA